VEIQCRDGLAGGQEWGLGGVRVGEVFVHGREWATDVGADRVRIWDESDGRCRVRTDSRFGKRPWRKERAYRAGGECMAR